MKSNLAKLTIKQKNKLLLQAAKDNNIDYAKLLLTNGANPNFVDDNHKSCLFYAIDNNNNEFFDLIINSLKLRGRKITCGLCCYERAISSKNIDMVKKLVDLEVKFDSEVFSNKQVQLIFFAAKYNSGIEFKDFIKVTGLDINSCDIEGNNALHYAIYLDCPLSLILLAEEGVDVNCCNFSNQTPLMMIANSKNLSRESVSVMISALVKAGADINSDWKISSFISPLLIAIESENIYAVEELLKNGADIYEQFDDGNNIFNYAITKNNPDLLKLLSYKILYLRRMDLDIMSRLGNQESIPVIPLGESLLEGLCDVIVSCAIDDMRIRMLCLDNISEPYHRIKPQNSTVQAGATMLNDMIRDLKLGI